MHLKKKRNNYLHCKICDYMNYVNQEENILDNRSEEILERMMNLLNHLRSTCIKIKKLETILFKEFHCQTLFR